MTWALVDNLLYARLTADRAGIHPAVALLAVLGGLTTFAAGLGLGRALLAVTVALLQSWHNRRADIV